MNCYDCHATGSDTTAVAACRTCGAGICGDHAHSRPETLHRISGTGVATLPRSARRITCGTCTAAETRL
ncbi:DUF2180 family protein [Streptomyces meridianus]|uniref:DUF2180 family protein n=1 Tax=Streptomyces meridianus TaxID=2938945 RepID=A0ABT0X7D2_9ACTN|nr:DUF2180 family protein [Streptomyces meridianus]MCM2578438.1 DUF2180 family protein [Streptomyces meridianus]